MSNSRGEDQTEEEGASKLNTSSFRTTTEDTGEGRMMAANGTKQGRPLQVQKRLTNLLILPSLPAETPNSNLTEKPAFKTGKRRTLREYAKVEEGGHGVPFHQSNEWSVRTKLEMGSPGS